MNRSHARCFKRNRISDNRAYTRSKNTTMIAGLTLKGMIAPRSIIGGMNGRKFIKWLDTELLPKLRKNSKIIMDNVPFHHMKSVKKLIKSYACKAIYLPPYSPDLNPIEKAWSKIKAYLRKHRPKTLKSIQMHFHIAIKTITESDAIGYFKASGVVK